MVSMGKAFSSTTPMPAEVADVVIVLQYKWTLLKYKMLIIFNAPITRGIFFVALVHVGNLQKRMGAIL